ncbi:MAG: hypothetical protein GTO12_01755, partial [Proteobacteria bacterium]|nr:hypothetical protein [Pseudomonadota bacterium]
MKLDATPQSMSSQERNLLSLSLDRETLFSNHKNVYNKRVEKRQRNLLKKIRFIKNFLKDGEKILLVTTGCSPVSILEQLVTGWIFIYLKRCMFIFTDKRIFHIPTSMSYSYRDSIAQILYTDCKLIRMKGRTLVIEYKNGKKEKFHSVARRERKKIRTLLETISLEGSPSKATGRVHICPRCTHELEEEKYTCPNCHLEFKNKAEGRRISLIYPGGGYFYTRHPFLGVGDAITETVLLVLA